MSTTIARKLIQMLTTIALFFLVSCAWENLPEGVQEKQRIIEVTMKTGGAMRPDLFYYIVFNLSGDPSKKPYSIFEGEDRGKYWSVYYMWGKPPYKNLGLYRGFGGKGKDGKNLVDNPPLDRSLLHELTTGTSVSGDRMTLRIDLSKLAIPASITSINMNMIVCNQAIDADSRVDYQYAPYVFDSFYDRGITIPLTGVGDYWDEANNPQERLPNEHENSAPPEANITDWRFFKISW